MAAKHRGLDMLSQIYFFFFRYSPPIKVGIKYTVGKQHDLRRKVTHLSHIYYYLLDV
jgi:hypothetical protein